MQNTLSKGKEMKNKILKITNRKAYYNYFLSDRLIAGIVLSGAEVKGLRHGNGNFQDAYCYFNNFELWLKGLHVTSSYYMQNPIQNEYARKLLLKKQELKKLFKKKEIKGYTIIPIHIFLNIKGIFKVEIALGKGKHNYDKRATIKERDLARRLAQENK